MTKQGFVFVNKYLKYINTSYSTLVPDVVDVCKHTQIKVKVQILLIRFFHNFINFSQSEAASSLSTCTQVQFLCPLLKYFTLTKRVSLRYYRLK